jgi:hypothetical protein
VFLLLLHLLEYRLFLDLDKISAFSLPEIEPELLDALSLLE